MVGAMVGVPRSHTVFDGQEATEVASGPLPAVKYVVEAVGTFFLVFTVGAAVGLQPFRPIGYRCGPNGDDLRRRASLGWALQPGGDVGGAGATLDRAA